MRTITVTGDGDIEEGRAFEGLRRQTNYQFLSTSSQLIRIKSNPRGMRKEVGKYESFIFFLWNTLFQFMIDLGSRSGFGLVNYQHRFR